MKVQLVTLSSRLDSSLIEREQYEENSHLIQKGSAVVEGVRTFWRL